jgi:hypothetical protein
MIVLDPENIGCGRKLPYGTLLELQEYVSSRFPAVAKWQDSAIEQSFALDVKRAASIDRTIRFCSDDRTFVRAAIFHACNDVLVAMARPYFASISIGFAAQDLDERRHIAVTHQIFETLLGLNMTVGKLHSFMDQETNLTVSVHGAIEFTPFYPSTKGAIYVSKPIGALKAIYLANVGYSITQLQEAIRVIGANATSLIDIIGPLKIGATDISGFGLIHAADQYMRSQGIAGEISLSDVPVVDSCVHDVAVECLNRGAGYKSASVKIGDGDRGSVGDLSEVNGPFLLFVPNVAERQIEECKRFTRIGEWVREQSR